DLVFVGLTHARFSLTTLSDGGPVRQYGACDCRLNAIRAAVVGKGAGGVFRQRGGVEVDTVGP
ncbi:MAG: hypothetical protein ACR2M5_10270, partial [Nakamurella sp.]